MQLSFKYGGTTHTFDWGSGDWLFEDAGKYDVLLVVWDEAGNIGTDNIVVTVLDTTPPVADAGNDIWIDQGGTALFDGRSSTDNVGITNWLWTFEYDGGSRSVGGISPTYDFELPGEVIVTLTVTDAAGNIDNATMTVTVRDTRPPTLVFLPGDLDLVEGETVSWDATGSFDNVAIERAVWTIRGPGRTVTLEGLSVEHQFDETGEYEVTLTVEDAAGNAATDEFKVTVEGDWTHWALWVVVIVLAIGILVLFWLRLRSSGDGDT
jgi:PKD repeat protein